MPTIDVDGRGKTVKEAVQDMWHRIVPLEKDGYHVVSSVEVVDTRTNAMVETFQLTDPEWSYLKTPGTVQGRDPLNEEHRPLSPHEFQFKARVRLQA